MLSAAARGILPKINFPHEALLLAGLAQILVNFAVKATLVVGILVLFRVPVPLTAVLVVIPLAGLLLMGIAVGVLLVPVGALFQDVVHALGVVASSLVFLTPAAYTPPRVGLLGLITAWNPLTPLIMTARDLIVLGTALICRRLSCWLRPASLLSSCPGSRSDWPCRSSSSEWVADERRGNGGGRGRLEKVLPQAQAFAGVWHGGFREGNVRSPSQGEQIAAG